MKTAIITGVAGQDGALLANHLLKKDYIVVGVLPSGRESDLYRLKFLGIDARVQLKKVELLNEHELHELLDETRPDEFYNLAAISSVGYSFKQPHQTFDFNTRSVINILESLRKVSPSTRFYQASSSEMFGNIGRDKLPVKESFLFHPVSPYGISKASAHWLTINYREAYKLDTCCGILFNHESALRPDNYVIKKIIRSAINIKAGTLQKLKVGNTRISRDWGYAPYYVDAMWRMLQQETLHDFLICSGTPMLLADFINKVFGALDIDAYDHIETDPDLLRSLDLEIIYGDNRMAKNALGWEYSLSTDDLVQRLIQDERALIKWQEHNLKA